MTRRMCVRRPGTVLAAVCLVGLACAGAAEREDASLAAASRIVQASRAAGGICAVVGASDAKLALAIARCGPFVVQCLCGSAERTAALRGEILSRGLYGTVSAETLQGSHLPYTDNLVNIVVVLPGGAEGARAVPAGEILRALAPLGTVFVQGGGSWKKRLEEAGAGSFDASPDDRGWIAARKPWPGDIDEWTHYLHGADGNPVARDRVVGPPRHYQWVSSPLWMRSHESDSSISTLVTARGRLFYIVDEAPTSVVGQHPLPDKWFLAARDAFNGVDLWKVPIRRWGWREWKSSWFDARPGDFPLNIQKRLVAVGDKVYVTLGYQAPVSELDAATGEILKTYGNTERTNEILYKDGKLVLSILKEGGAEVAAFDAASGKRLWVTGKAYRGSTVDYIRWKAMHGSTKPAVLDPSLNTATDGKVVALIDGPDLVVLDAASGAEMWRKPFPSAGSDLKAGGMRSGGNLWIGTMIVKEGVVLHASPGKLAGFSARTGKLLWSQPKQFIQHLWYEWKDVFVIGDLVWTWNAELKKGRSRYPTSANGYDIHSGEQKRSVPLGMIFNANHHHRCYRNKATSRYILASRRGTEFVDLLGGKHTVHNWVRGICHLGMMPANGLQYAPPHPCKCYFEEKLNGMNALAAARPDEASAVPAAAGERLEKGPAFGRVPAPQAGKEDWPAFRHDGMRSGAATTSVGDGAALLWRVRVGGKVCPPVAAGGRVYVSSVDRHQVVCLDARDGRTVWAFTAGARVDSPPTCHEGMVLFGSADGWIYCLRAGDGALSWRFRAAPARRLIGAFGQLESVWPVHGSVLVHDGTVYAAAGRTSHLDGGIHVCALDAAQGRLVHETVLSGPKYAAGDFKENFRLPMGALSDVLLWDGEKIRMHTTAFDPALELVDPRGPARSAGRRKQPGSLEVPGGFLDGNYFKRMPWSLDGQYARLIVHDGRRAFYVRMFDSLQGLNPNVFFTPGARGYLLFARDLEAHREVWNLRIPVRVRAMVLARNRLVVAGPPDVIDPKDPLGAFEGRKGGILYVFDAGSGEKLAERDLPSPPVFNGAAAARGRLLVVSEDGSVSCFGSRSD